ncbi:MAG: SWIM zinc finger family protein [Desulfobacterales bacterium]|nr:SWIM zinc finger family protein [Desulfobacterales bacterium]
MSNENNTEKGQSEPDSATSQTTQVSIGYAAANSVTHTEKDAQIRVFGNLYRDPVDAEARICSPLRFREAMSALHRVVSSDFRYIPKDRTAYLAYLRLKRESASMSAWNARHAYFSWLARNDPEAWMILDPVVTVHPDMVIFEVFSKDEGSYAMLGMTKDAFEFKTPPVCGTTNIDFGDELFRGIQNMRSFRNANLAITRKAVKLSGDEQDDVLQKKINVPDSWFRGFLQVQSAAVLPEHSFMMAPVDLYNVLRYLRFHADIKGRPRGMCIELVPGEHPRIVLEPWNQLIETSHEVYKGKGARVIRIWGRRRLMMLCRFLHLADQIEVRVTGSGLPSFWILRAGDMALALGITGFTSSDWSRALSFDLLMPRTQVKDTSDLEKILAHLSDKWSDTAKGISTATGLKQAALLKTLQTGCQQGSLMYDMINDVYRLRPLTDTALTMARLEFRNERERFAHDLLNRKGAVTIETENRIFGSGLELTGKVTVTEDKRDYRPVMLIDEEGRVRKAECTCSFFRKQGLRQGPCPHLIALRVCHFREEEQRMKSKTARERIVLDTRIFSKRSKKGEDICQLTLDRRKLKIRRGIKGRDMRVQSLRFNSTGEARVAYFMRLEEMAEQGYLDATG